MFHSINNHIYLYINTYFLLLLLSFVLQLFANYYLQACWKVVVSQQLPHFLNI